MKVYRLSFGQINIIEPNLAEVIIDDEVVMDVEMIDEYHEFLLSYLKAPFSLLVNKCNSYTYTFEAQRMIASLNEIKAMAVVTHTAITEMSTSVLITMNQDKNWNIKLFQKREDALNWLQAV